ncbi:hypothetical protein NPIL_329331 [Nephila pilipes]|uniref:Uncharacterized protein n=1 Tax=Nephila pilipes TaxID=299642 RepID=A0A8X6N590_NEPPI|nr:hypothetical protein NPIL_329331 [Nephila pilipes]
MHQFPFCCSSSFSGHRIVRRPSENLFFKHRVSMERTIIYSNIAPVNPKRERGPPLNCVDPEGLATVELFVTSGYFGWIEIPEWAEGGMQMGSLFTSAY